MDVARAMPRTTFFDMSHQPCVAALAKGQIREMTYDDIQKGSVNLEMMNTLVGGHRGRLHDQESSKFSES